MDDFHVVEINENEFSLASVHTFSKGDAEILVNQIKQNDKFRKQHKCSFDDEGTHCPYQEILMEIEKRWKEINVDIDAKEDCVKMCITLQKILKRDA